jgi:hypothetical protein
METKVLFNLVEELADEAGGNKAGTTGTGMSARKLEEETEDFNGTPS